MRLDRESKPNYRGVEELAEVLKTNDTLLYLNLNNTGLDGEASKKIREAMEKNSTLIL